MKTAQERKEFINKFYQPLGHLRCNVSADRMWEYAEMCAGIAEEYASQFKQPQLPIGEEGKPLTLNFGFGEVQVMNAREHDEENLSIAVFRKDDNPKPVGTESNEFKGMTENEVNGILCRFKFHNTQSIDVVIESLMEIRRSMEQTQPLSTEVEEGYNELCKEISRLQEKYDENGYDCSSIIKLQRIEDFIDTSLQT